MATIVRAPNRAGEEVVIEAVKTRLAPMQVRVRADKLVLNQIGMRFWNIWAARHDVASYKGRTRAYLTSGRKMIESWVSMLKRGAFPVSGKWFACDARDHDSEDNAETVQALLRRELREYMNIRRKASPILRGVVILGTQPLDIGWKVTARDVPTLEAVMEDGGNGKSRKRMQETVKRVVSYLGPTLRPVDFFRWYCWPTTVNDVADLDLSFEDFLQDPRELERLSKVPIVKGKEKELGFHIDPAQWKEARRLLPRGDNASDKWQAQRRRLAARGFQIPMVHADDPTVVLDCERGYWLTKFDKSEEPALYEYIIGGDAIPLRMREVSTGLLGGASYMTPKFLEVLEEFYGYGLPSSFDSIHYLLNDILNQTADALTWGINPIVGVDPDAVQDHTTLQMKPGAKWLIRMPRTSISWMEPPKESAQAGIAAVQTLVGLANDTGGVQPFAPGGKVQKGRAADTYGGMQILATEGQLGSADVIQNLEDTWLNPMLRRMHDLNGQCLDEPILLNVESYKGAALIQTKITREKLIGEFDIYWLASLHEDNRNVKAAQFGQVLMAVTKIPPQMLAADNTKVSIGEMLRVWYKDLLMLPFADRVFGPATPVQSYDPELENLMFKQGRGLDVKVSPADDDAKHMQSHGLLLVDGTVPDEIKELAMKHIHQHEIAEVVKMIMKQQQAAGAAPGGGGGPGGGGPSAAPPNPALPPPGGQAPSNPGRPPVTASPDDLARQAPRPDLLGGGAPGMTA